MRARGKAPSAKVAPDVSHGADGVTPHELGRERVNDFQRARIVSAMVEVAAEGGYLGAAVAPVVARAGVSRRTFYELFDGREECFLAAFEWGVGQARMVVAEAHRSQRSWRDRVRSVLPRCSRSSTQSLSWRGSA